MIKLLAAVPRIDTTLMTSKGSSAFNSACHGGKKDVVAYFMADEKVDINNTTEDGYTAVYTAASKGNFEVVKMLLADPRLTTLTKCNSRGDSILFCLLLFVRDTWRLWSCCWVTRGLR